MLRIAVSGYYGFKNAGDDAILMALTSTLRALAPGAEITVFSNSPEETRELYGVRAVNRWNPFGIVWALLRSDLLISGGGGLLQDVTGGGVRSICYYLVVVLLALAAGKPVVYYAQGVGPVRSRFGRWLTRVVSNRADLITVRDQASRDDFLALGVSRPPLVVTADPVLALNPSQLNIVNGKELLERLRRDGLELSGPAAAAEPVAARTEEAGPRDGTGAPEPLQAGSVHQAGQNGRVQPAESGTAVRRRLGIVIRDWPDACSYKKCIAAAADRFARDGWEVILVPFHYPADAQICKEVSWLMQEPSLLVNSRLMVEDLFGLLGKLDLVLAMRLHAIVMASMMRAPCVGVSYDPKVDRFLELAGLPNAGSVASLDEERLYRALLDAWERRQEIAAHLDKVLAYLRQQAWETASLTLSVFYARSPKKRRGLAWNGSRLRREANPPPRAPAVPGAAGEPRGPAAGRGKNIDA